MLSSNGFIKDNVNKFATFYRLFDAVIILLSLFIAVTIYQIPFTKDLFLLSLISIIGFSFFAEMFALYRSWRDGFFKEVIFNALLSWTVAFCLILFYVFFTKSSLDYSRVVAAIWFFLTCFLLFFCVLIQFLLI